MSKRKAQTEDRCPKCGCPEMLTFARQTREGFRTITSCPGCSYVVPAAPAAVTQSAKDSHKATIERFVASIRSALATFDGADPSERHPDACPCELCEFVRSNRKLVADWDEGKRPLIYTRADGTPIPRPERADYPDEVGYLRAYWAWKDAIADVAGRAFDEQLKASLRQP